MCADAPVYNFIHIGNARPMIVFDTARRYMEYKGYEVNFVSNFTDVDDKIMMKPVEEGVSAEEISQRYIKECKKDMADMNVREATTHPLATQEIDGMIDMIQTLIDKGYAYDVNGTVYFRTRKFEEYGNYLIKIWMIFVRENVPFWYLERIRRRTLWILYSGNRKKRVSLSGYLRGAKDVLAGILNVLLWQKNIWEKKSIFTQAGRI